MSALSPVPATSSGAPWADPLTPLDSALTDCCLSYKQNVLISPLESALTNASHLLDSAHFETACFDTLASLPPVTPLESALKKHRGVGVPRHIWTSFASAIICATWRLYPLWPQSIAHTSRHHGGVPTRFRSFCLRGKPNWLVLCFHKLTNPFSRNSLVFKSIQNPRSGSRAPAVRGSFCSPFVTRHSPLVSGQGR